MPRRPNIRFTRFRQAQQEGLQALMRLMKEVFDKVARDGHQSDGRGLVAWVSTDGTVATLKPPGFVSAPYWRRTPLLINTPHPDLIQALITYDPKTSYIVLVAGPNPNKPALGLYTWWIEPFAADLAVKR
jgi:hypothetical protein